MLVTVIAALFVLNELDDASIASYIPVERPTAPAAWPGQPIDGYGRYTNHQFPFIPKLRELLMWQLSPNRFADEKRADDGRVAVSTDVGFFSGDADGIVWLGHASFMIRSGGYTLLIDPVFDDPPFITRFQVVPSQLDQIRRVDAVLLTHDHRDHLDENSLKQIATKFPSAIFLAGSGSRELLGEMIGDAGRVRTANWFERFDTGNDDIRVTFAPVRHWSRRGLFDLNRRLWGGYVIETPSFSAYHGGDSGYGDHYRLVGEAFPSIDYFLIGIGAYEPRWFMEANHNDPNDAVKAFRDINARYLVPMHYGTFDLSDEPPSQPLRFLKDAMSNNNLSDRLMVVGINEPIFPDTNRSDATK